MKRSLLRTIVVYVAIAFAVINIYPTLGWLIFLDDAERDARMAQWKQEDDERARVRPSQWQKTMYGIKRWAEFDRERVINLGLDLQGGVHMVLGFDIADLSPEKLTELREEADLSDAEIASQVQETVLQQIRRRVADFEADEPVIQALGTNQIQVQLPGEKDIDRARSLMTKVAKLDFNIVADQATTATTLRKIFDAFPNELQPLIERPSMSSPYFQFNADNLVRVREGFAKAAERTDLIPADKMIAFSQPPKPFEDQKYTIYLLDKTPIASGEGLRSAGAIPDQMNPPYWQIHFQFTAEKGTEFGRATEANIDRPMAIVVDGAVLSAPTIRDRISTNGQITGNFDGEEARDLAIALNSGSMVVEVREDFTRVIGASLGADAVRAGYTSAVGALVLVGAFLAIYYLAGGLVAVFALFLNSIFAVAAMAYFDLTLTMPGIAGLILTIAVAVDGNVLIYERIREELRMGHSLLSSIEAGFSRAGVTILDANVTNLIAAAILYQFGTGPLEGFSIALAIGICVGVFTALVVSHAIIDFLVDRKLIKHMKMLSIIPAGTKIQFMQAWKVCMAASALLLVVGYAVFIGRELSPEGTNFGVDFTEGTNLRVLIDADGRVPVAAVREALDGANFTSPIVQETGETNIEDSNEFVIRVGEISGTSTSEPGAENPVLTTVGERIQQSLAALSRTGDISGVEVRDLQTVGPAIGTQLRLDALQALFWSLLFVTVFLWYRFELRFALGAVAAVLHDVLITVGILSLIGEQITMNVVAGLLTIIGFSLNDTIVIFDRVREDMRVYRGKGYSFFDILNIALNATLGRTLLTSMIALFVMLVLFFFGGNAIHDFAITLIIGMIVGTYSSVYIASPIAYLAEGLLKKKKGENEEDAASGPGKGKKSKRGKNRPAEATV